MYSNSDLSIFDGYVPCGEYYSLFIEKLSEENNWSKEFSEQAVIEYIKFLKIIKIYGVKQTPSKIVDEVWHLHLQFTKDYWEDLCPRILGMKLHHVPTLKNEESNKKNFKQYSKTLEHYRELFGSPPKLFWVEVNGLSTIKCQSLPIQDKCFNVLLLCSIILLGLVGASNFTFLSFLSGEQFLIIYGILIVFYNLLALIVFKGAKEFPAFTALFGFVRFGYLGLAALGMMRMLHGTSNSLPVQYLGMEFCFGVGLPLICTLPRRNGTGGSNDSSSCSSCSSSSSSSSGDGGGGGGCGGCGGGD